MSGVSLAAHASRVLHALRDVELVLKATRVMGGVDTVAIDHEVSVLRERVEKMLAEALT